MCTSAERMPIFLHIQTNTLFYCVQMTTRVQSHFRVCNANKTFAKRIRTNDESDVLWLVRLKSRLLACFSCGYTKRTEYKKKCHRASEFINIFCLQGIQLNLLSVKAETNWVLRTFAQNF